MERFSLDLRDRKLLEKDVPWKWVWVCVKFVVAGEIFFDFVI